MEREEKIIEGLGQLELFPTGRICMGTALTQTRYDISLRALELQNLGFSIREKTCGGKKIISWTSKNHWGQAVYDENSGEDLELVAEKLREGIVSARNEKQRKHGI